MIFKPRIFISSTFDLIPARKKIDSIFGASGAEVMLYEKNLTPSSRKATYRKDIQDAEFAIFILDKRYGNITEETGISGTHEEWRIANSYNIPSHVYINMNSEKERGLENLIEELNKEAVSYYFYQNENDLFKRMKETIFGIATEIANNRINNYKFKERDIKTISFNYDYEIITEYFKIIEDIMKLQHSEDIGILDTNIIMEALSYMEYKYMANKYPFIDMKLNDKFEDLIKSYDGFCTLHTRIYTSNGTSREVYLKSLGFPIKARYLTYHGNGDDREKLVKLLEEFLSKYIDIKNYVMQRKIYIDLL